MGIKIRIEASLLLIFFASSLSGPVNTNFVIYRTCYVILQQNQSDCAKLGLNFNDSAIIALEKKVEPYANMIQMTTGLVSALIPVFVCLFIGPWSDKNGRKIVLLTNAFGTFLMYVVRIIVSLIPNANPWCLLLESVPIMLSGGMGVLIMITLCYITDATTIENRGLRMGVMEASIMLGLLLGVSSSSYVFAALNYSGVYTLSALCAITAFLLIYFFLEDTIRPERLEFRSLFTLQHIKEMLRATFKRRDNYKRPIILILIVSMGLFMVTMKSSTITNLYFRSQFGWTLKHFTTFSGIESGVLIFGTFIGVYILHKLLSFPEMFLLIVAFVLQICNDFILAFAKNDAQIYIGCAMNIFIGVISPMLRSLLSKAVSTEDVGKIFALSVAFETAMMVTNEPSYTLIYNATIKTFPGAFNLFSATLSLIEVILMGSILIFKRKQTVETYGILSESVL